MDLKYNCGDDRNSDEQLYINVHEFHFVSNKTLNANDFYRLCQKEKNLTEIDGVLDSITAEGRIMKKESTSPKFRSVQNVIDDLKAFELREEFISKIEFDIESLGWEDVLEGREMFN